MKKIVSNVKKFINKNRKIVTFVTIIVMIVFVVFLSNSFGYFKKRIEGGKLTFNVGTLSYELECVDLENCEVTIPANQSKAINVNLTSLNSIDTKYELYYEVVAPEELTNIIDGGHLVTSEETFTYMIDANETRAIELAINNTGDEEITLKLGALPSLKSDNVVLEDEQVSLNKEVYQKYYVYDYSGDYETFVVPQDGYYQLEVWGAQGGSYNSTCIGGYGSYSIGNVYLEKSTTLTVVVGGKGLGNGTHTARAGGYNGGGSATSDSDSHTRQSSGGGATHIATTSGLLSSLSNAIDDILIVAGGGGGGAGNSAIMCTNGGNAGGYKGNSGKQYYESSSIYGTGHGGTQTSGGSYSSSRTDAYNVVGSFGTGASSRTAGGGGGYYGGGVAFTSAGGGSGYVGNTSLTNKAMYCYNCTESGEETTKTISITNVSETPTSNYAKQGDGYAKITFLKGGSYTVKYNSNGGTGTMEDDIFFENGEYTLSANEFTKEGYGFVGWSLLADSNEVVYEDSEIVANIGKKDEVINLYAVWAKSYTITFDGNGGTVSPSTKTVSYGLEYGELPIPVKTGYTFYGWYTQASEGTEVTSSDTVVLDSDQTLYARWSENALAATYIKEAAPTGFSPTAYNGMYRYIGPSSDNYAKLGDVLYRIVGITSAANSTLGLEANQIKVVKVAPVGLTAWDTRYTKDTAPSGITFQNSQIKTYLQGSEILGNTSVIPTEWVEKIDTVKWYQGNCQTTSGVSTVINCEKSSVTSSSFKIGLVYLSDYYYSITGGASSSSGYYSVTNDSWIGEAHWMLTRYGYHPDGYWSGWACRNTGCRRPGTNGTYAIMPSFYLLPDVTYVSGAGTADDPFILD